MLEDSFRSSGDQCDRLLIYPLEKKVEFHHHKICKYLIYTVFLYSSKIEVLALGIIKNIVPGGDIDGTLPILCIGIVRGY
jgi:hypothetical protein